MGYPTHELIPAAIIYENPGLTWDQIMDRISKVHVSTGTKFSKDDPLDVYNPDSKYPYHIGLKGFADLFNLELSDQFKAFHQTKTDVHGFPMEPIEARRYTHYGTDKPYWEVRIHVGNEVYEEMEFRDNYDSEIQPGKIIGLSGDSREGLVTRVVSSKPGKTRYLGRWIPTTKYTLRAFPFHRMVNQIEYESDQEFEEAYPVYKTENMYNFNQERGAFDITKSRNRFWWVQNDRKYYLDPDTFDITPLVRRGHIYGEGYCLSDLVMTLEAMKCGAWKLFSNRGFDHLGQFKQAYPEAFKRYEDFVMYAFRPRQPLEDETVGGYLRRRLTYGIEI